MNIYKMICRIFHWRWHRLKFIEESLFDKKQTISYYVCDYCNRTWTKINGY
jgi:hypothetical protein